MITKGLFLKHSCPPAPPRPFDEGVRKSKNGADCRTVEPSYRTGVLIPEAALPPPQDSIQEQPFTGRHGFVQFGLFFVVITNKFN